MTIAELRAVLLVESDDDALIEANRVRTKDAIDELRKRFSPPSQCALCQFQVEFFREHPRKPPFAHFIRGQNMVIEGMIQIELSALGMHTRQKFGLDPLTDETVLTVDSGGIM